MTTILYIIIDIAASFVLVHFVLVLLSFFFTESTTNNTEEVQCENHAKEERYFYHGGTRARVKVIHTDTTHYLSPFSLNLYSFLIYIYKVS